MSSKILPLPESVRSQLRSGVSITCVGQCVEELVLNSLDAGATCIAVRIDFSIFRIQVVDNGHGICHGNLKVLGSRHSTSKCHSLQDLSNNLTHYGFRGEALASIVDLAAIIDITTRSFGSTDTYTKLFMYGKEKSVSPSSSQRPSVGTTITIQDFMYNMPVRRKLIKEAIDIENICIRLKSFALMHPNVSFSMKNDNTNDQIFQVLGQVDKKFIACNIKYTLHDEPNSPQNLLVLFDQHAVDERVRLESIIKENLEIADSGKRVIVTSMVTPPLSLCLPDDEVRLMVAYKDIFFQRGLHFSKISTSEISFHAIPNCIVAREYNISRSRRGQTANAVVESIVRDLCHTLYTTGGVVGFIPKPLQYLMNSQACRGAVKFGDELTLSQCQELIDSLGSCQLPFQCAHGRPSVVPVVNMTHLAKLEKREGKPNIKKLVAQMSSQENKLET